MAKEDRSKQTLRDLDRHSAYALTTSRTGRMVLRALLLALSFILSMIDHSLPPLWAGVPGFSLGLANIVILFALVFEESKEAIYIAAGKSIFVFFLRGPLTLLLSLSGAFLSLAVELLLLKSSGRRVSLLLLSALGGLAHNLGQIIAYAYYAKVELRFMIAPLALTGLIAGVLTAFVLRTLLPFINRWLNASMVGRRG